VDAYEGMVIKAFTKPFTNVTFMQPSSTNVTFIQPCKKILNFSSHLLAISNFIVVDAYEGMVIKLLQSLLLMPLLYNHLTNFSWLLFIIISEL